MKSHTDPLLDIPKWSALLVEAVNKPGLIMDAYSAFHDYSIGNQILALVQCHMRGVEPGPINTFPGWQTLGRNVKRGSAHLFYACQSPANAAATIQTTTTTRQTKITLIQLLRTSRVGLPRLV